MIALIVKIFERFYVAPRETKLGRALTRGERAAGALLLTAPLILFLLVCIVRGLLYGFRE